MDVQNIFLEETCPACPEQYDAIDRLTNEIIGYLRLRHGHFRVEVPNVGGELIYEAHPHGDGCFTDKERPIYLSAALNAIAGHYNSI